MSVHGSCGILSLIARLAQSQLREQELLLKHFGADLRRNISFHQGCAKSRNVAFVAIWDSFRECDTEHLRVSNLTPSCQILF